MIHRNKTKILICVILISVVFIFWRWFFDLSILSAGDWGFFYGEFQKTFLTFPYLWVGNLSFGGVDISLSMYPAVFLFGILSHFVNFAFAERILYFWPVVFISILGSFFLVKKITGSDAASITGSIVFLCNTYFLTLGTGHLTVMMGVALAPLILLFFIKTLEQKKMITAIITGFLCFAASFYEFRIFYLILWILFFYFLFYCFIIDKVNFKKFLINAFWASIPVILSVLLNFYWIFGFYTLNIAADTRVFNRGLFGNSYMNLLRSISLFHPFWTGAKLSSFVVQQIPVHFGLVPLFAFLGFLLNRKNKFVLFFGVLSLLGIFFSKQVAEPFPALYFWFYNNLPGFNAFREASKFYFFISLGYAVLIGAFVFWLWNKISGWKKWKFTRYLLIFLIAFTFLWNAKPVIIGNLGKLFISRSIPADYIILKDDILRQSSDYFRMMWMPVYSRWSYYDSEHPKISLANLCMGDWKDFVDFKSIDYSWPMQDRIIKVLNLPFSNNLLDQSSIKYIIVPIRDLENDDDFFASYGGNRDFFITELDKIKFL